MGLIVGAEVYGWKEFQKDLEERKAPGYERFLDEDCKAEFALVPIDYLGLYLQLRDDCAGGGGLLSRDARKCLTTEIEGISGFVECFLRYRNPGPGRNRCTEKEARRLALQELGRG